ncbi:carboxylesterase [Anaeramoeba flamelloides]|uniref:Carboxylic ester hydrolase n=1 Tax=Anaeramoeba flamelloides TaxID=1746091 RepID=A0AAV8ACW9_9EUKA|nr:carboxylesterase [Anaeramoeba flamelloides]
MKKFLTIALFLILFSQLSVVSCLDYIVETECGSIFGKKTGTTTQAYLGIRYAQPPTGAYRFQPPRSVDKGQDCQALAGYGAMCPQSLSGKVAGSEDCLFLNVWAPKSATTSSNLPVLVWIHGGGLINNNGGFSVYGTPEIFAEKHNMVVVSMNYRLGLLGFLALDALNHSDQRGVSGNYGILDQLESLKWVQKNIKQFGGNPQDVTIFGQSAGAASALMLTASDLSEGLFHRTIAMSAPAGLIQTQETACQDNLKGFVQASSCKGKTGNDLVKCLYNMDYSEFVTDIYKVSNYLGTWFWGLPDQPIENKYPLLTIDQYLIKESLPDSFKNGNFQKVDLLVSWMTEEIDLLPNKIITNYSEKQYKDLIVSTFDNFQSGLGDQVYKLYPFSDFENPQMGFDQITTDIGPACLLNTLGQNAAKNLPSDKNLYFYISPQKPQIKGPCFLGTYCSKYAFHMFDSFAVFNNTPAMQLGKTDIEYGSLIRNALSQFIKTGKIESPAWEPFVKNNLFTWLQVPGPKLISNPRTEKCKFWDNNGFTKYMWQC